MTFTNTSLIPDHIVEEFLTAACQVDPGKEADVEEVNRRHGLRYSVHVDCIEVPNSKVNNGGSEDNWVIWVYCFMDYAGDLAFTITEEDEVAADRYNQIIQQEMERRMNNT